MIRREITDELTACAAEYPVVTITGPRQSGKTTLARHFFSGFEYVNFELPDVRAAFNADPRGFLAARREGAVFDEAQRVPQLFSWLQGMVDEDPRPGRFAVTGSQHFGLNEKITQSLAGRTAVLELLPFSLEELEQGGRAGGDLDEVLFEGAYPPVHDRGLRPPRWYSGYVATYVERDLRQLSSIQDLDLFQRFMTLVAGRVGQLMNTSSMSNDLGVDHKTVSRWLSLLVTSYLAVRVLPYHTSFRKRLVKTPKYYLLDTGLVCHLLGIRESAQLATHPLRGSIFENWVASELIKARANSGERGILSFWRTHEGSEVDFVIEGPRGVDLVECKSGQTVMPKMIEPLRRTSRLWDGADARRWVVYGGDRRFDMLDTALCPWRMVGELNG